MRNLSYIILFLSVALASCGGNDNEGKENIAELKKQQKELQDKITKLEGATKKSDSVRKVPVLVTSMTPSVFNNYIEVQGKIDLDEVVNAIPEVPGIIQSILVRPGQYVRKGQVVATLRAESVEKGIDELDQQINFAKVVYDKQKRLWDEEIGTEIQLLQAKNNYEALLKKKQTTLTQKSNFNVYSPINGVVDAIDASVGQSFSNPIAAPVIRIINTSKLRVLVAVPENYSSIVRTGSNCVIAFPDIQDTLATRINYVEKMINSVSRTYAAYIPLPSNSKYQPNMTAQVKIATYQNNRAFVLPSAVIQKTDNGNFVYVADANSKSKLIPVQLGNTYQSKVEILSGLNLGDRVITTGYEDLNEGDLLEIQ
ncbi:MAG: efflux RND transporter periplasmic adaptor subunit [Chitinophagaceae bacterium]|nr:efflux RND transporter periplasmic adaptor subunit [Chitinophagaceae bacterium]